MNSFLVAAALVGFAAAAAIAAPTRTAAAIDNIQRISHKRSYKNVLLRGANVPADGRQNAQYVDMYDYPNQSGSSLRASDYVPSLRNYGFDNVASSVCFNGIWLLYDLEYYNEQSFTSGATYGWGENHCINLDSALDNKASSVRFTGAPDGYKYDTINFYEGNYFMGKEHYYYNDAPSFEWGNDNLGNSVVVTGCSPWTIYQYNNYQGSAFCLFPSDTSQCYPSFFGFPQDLGGLAGQISSTRKGCFSEVKLYGTHVPKNSMRSHTGTFVPPRK